MILQQAEKIIIEKVLNSENLFYFCYSLLNLPLYNHNSPEISFQFYCVHLAQPVCYRIKLFPVWP